MKINFLKKFNQNQKMPKRNLIFLTLLISVLMVSVVSAGITGYVLKRGLASEVPNLGTVSVQEVSGDTATFTFVDPNTKRTEILSGTEGQIVTTSSGTQVEVKTVAEGSLFRRGTLEINVVPPAPVSVITETEEECSDNCQTFTEVYKVEELQTITIGGDTISINFISATQVILDVNGQLTNLLSEDQKFELSNGQIVVVKNVAKLEVAGTTGFVELGVLSSYKLKEGQVINLQGDLISINFISATQVILDINGQLTDLLSEDNTFELSNGQIATIQDVLKLEVAGEIGWVVLDPSSCYFVF